MSKIKLAHVASHRWRGCSRIILTGLVWLALVSASFGQATFVGVHGRLAVQGTKIVDQNRQPVALHGMSLYCWGPPGVQFYNAGAINHLAQDWKCTVIRIAVLPRNFKRNPTNEILRGTT